MGRWSLPRSGSVLNSADTASRGDVIIRSMVDLLPVIGHIRVEVSIGVMKSNPMLYLR